MRKICFATNNQHKLKEVEAVLGSSFQIVSLASIGCTEELPEEFDTLEGNSLQKAQYVFNRYGIPCFADDTGLEVEALHGAPGVHSAYYAGSQRNAADNMSLLLKNLHQIKNRQAQFRTVITWVSKEAVVSFQGVMKGEITESPKGNSGFGYDPIFRPEGYTKTLGEMTLLEKNSISHRAIAIQKFVEYLRTSG